MKKQAWYIYENKITKTNIDFVSEKALVLNKYPLDLMFIALINYLYEVFKVMQKSNWL